MPSTKRKAEAPAEAPGDVGDKRARAGPATSIEIERCTS
jgi:hypothetical protein